MGHPLGRFIVQSARNHRRDQVLHPDLDPFGRSLGNLTQSYRPPLAVCADELNRVPAIRFFCNARRESLAFLRSGLVGHDPQPEVFAQRIQELSTAAIRGEPPLFRQPCVFNRSLVPYLAPRHLGAPRHASLVV